MNATFPAIRTSFPKAISHSMTQRGPNCTRWPNSSRRPGDQILTLQGILTRPCLCAYGQRITNTASVLSQLASRRIARASGERSGRALASSSLLIDVRRSVFKVLACGEGCGNRLGAGTATICERSRRTVVKLLVQMSRNVAKRKGRERRAVQPHASSAVSGA